MTATAANAEPVLRTLAPALRQLEQRLRQWLTTPRPWPLPALVQAGLEGLANDLHRHADALDVEKPLLVIMFMGGTGVGKSSLLNALAGSPIADASAARPTTRDPVVYYHESVSPDQLDPALRECRLVAHRRPRLEQKILVDTPDLDSNELANRELLKRLLQIADVVLYVGSQEKYHDQLGWQLFLEHRQRRAFAFVLNKWDRCLHGSGDAGVRPDDDLLRDLKQYGFDRPLLFRTCAQAWTTTDGQPPTLPEGEQFRELEQWLELGLTRLEIEAIKARGVAQLLAELERKLEAARPPDLTAPAAAVEKAWRHSLRDEAATIADILLITLDPHQREIEHHFSMEMHQRFRGMMGTFLRAINKLRFFGMSLRNQVTRPWQSPETPDQLRWNLDAFARSCTALAADRHLDARGQALTNHLLLRAEQEQFPLVYLHESTRQAGQLDWRGQFSEVLLQSLREVERAWIQPEGSRRGLHALFVWLGDLLPLAVLLLSCAYVVNDYFQIWAQERRLSNIWEAVFLPPILVLLTMIALYVVILMVLPIRWPAIRSAFSRRVRERLEAILEQAYLPIPERVAEELVAERRQVEQIIADARQVATWVAERERTADISALYGD